MYDYERGQFLGGVAGVALPLAQSFISGGITFFLALAAAILIKLEDPALWAVGAAGIVAAAVWFSSLVAWRRIVYQLEPAGEWQPEQDQAEDPAPIRVEVEQREGRHVDYVDLPATTEQLIALASGLLEGGATLSEAAWTGAGNIFTRAEFSQLRAELIARGLAAWNNPKTPARGAVLTLPGRSVMRKFAAMAADSPTLQGGSTRKAR